MLERSPMRGALAACALFAAAGLPSAYAVDGAIQINQARALAGNVTAGDTAGFPITINTSGYYVLTSNLVVPNQNTTAIVINANNVTIDLNGFAMLGPNVCATDGFSPAQPCTAPAGSTYAGIGVDGGSQTPNTVSNTRVINGTIDGVGGMGIFGNVNMRIEGVNVSNCGSYGIYTFGGLIKDVLVRACGNTGIATSGALITNSRSLFNRGYGIWTMAGSVLTGNIVMQNLSYGFVLTPDTRYTNNLIDGNNNGGPQISSGTAAGVNTCGTAACP